MATSTLSSKGQIVLPKEVREKLGLKPGDKVHFVEQPDGAYNIVPATADVRRLRGIVPKPKRPVSVDEMNEAISKRAARSAGRRP